MYEQVAGFIKEIGFPIFVAIYLLTHFRKILEKNTKALSELAKFVKNLNDNNEKKKSKTR